MTATSAGHRTRAEDKHVSFIMATLNKAVFLEAVLKNIREFIKHDDELIIMDGGSTDNTLDIVNKHYDIVTFFESERDNGSCYANNKALLKARGSIIVNLNDDDYFFPEGMRKAIDVMDMHPEIDALLCGGEYTEYDPETKVIRLIGYQYLPESKSLSADIKNFVCHTSAGYFLLNRRVLPMVGLFDTAVQAADTAYMSRLVLCGANFKYLNVKLFRHVRYPHSLQNNWQESRRDLIRIYSRHGEWSELMKNPYRDVINALRLDTSGDQSFSQVLTKSVLKTGFSIFFILQMFSTVFHKIIHGIYQVIPLSIRKKRVNNRGTAIVEPTWDASLR